MASATINQLKRVPHTPDGDQQFVEMMKFMSNTDQAFFRFLRRESILRPAVAEEIERYMHQRRCQMPRTR